MMPHDDDDLDFDDLSDVRHPDHDLSEWGIAYDRGPEPKPWFLRRGFLLVVAALAIGSLILPLVLRL